MNKYNTKQQELILNYLKPVSYTHLDVYKRQSLFGFDTNHLVTNALPGEPKYANGVAVFIANPSKTKDLINTMFLQVVDNTEKTAEGSDTDTNTTSTNTTKSTTSTTSTTLKPKSSISLQLINGTAVSYTHLETGLDFAISIDEAKEMLKENKSEYKIKLKTLYPSVTTDSITAEAFPDLIASFSTSFASSNANRDVYKRQVCIHNGIS